MSDEDAQAAVSRYDQVVVEGHTDHDDVRAQLFDVQILSVLVSRTYDVKEGRATFTFEPIGQFLDRHAIKPWKIAGDESA